jgi:hypothetical protein
MVLWETSDRVRGKRLRSLVPVLVEAMERHGHLHLVPQVRAGFLAMSGATIDRALHDREVAESAVTHHVRPRSGAATRCVPLTARTIRRLGSSRRTWWRPAGAHREGQLRANADVDGHRDGLDGMRAAAGAREVRKRMPFAVLEFDTDSVLMNETVKTYCDAGLVFTRCRPYGRTTKPGWNK